MYEFDGRVRYSEIDHTGKMTLPALINYFQDCSTFHSEEAGLGMERLKAEKKAWILSYRQVIVERYPGLGEKITDRDIATEFKGLYGNRNFYMKDAEGRRIACAKLYLGVYGSGKRTPGASVRRTYPSIWDRKAAGYALRGT